MKSLLPATQNPDLFTLVSESELFIRYREAFRQTAGHQLHFTTPPEQPDGLNTRMRIPVRLEGRSFGFLSLDSFRCPDETFDELGCRMLDEGAKPRQLRAARKLYYELPILSPALSKAMETMLLIFADQLGEHAEKIFLHITGSEPTTVIKARIYIQNHLDGLLSLEDVASRCGVSVCYFCKIFKRATGMTFTEYLTRARVEEAKHALLRPQARITEIAYAVGFQSLSQFNRSFKRLTSQSPTEYRLARANLLTRSAA
ncbi:MAG: AraC family transcriptional regulator [Verrucomicrobiaceae bacterium]|nr:MAG: AraC family transcriptional regulator [Verrucomicrobiaceae bacterium]